MIMTGATSVLQLVLALGLLPPTANAQPPVTPMSPVFTATGSAQSPVAGCYRSPILLRTRSSLLAIAVHHWDSRLSPCNDVGLKAITSRRSTDGNSWGEQRTILNDTLPSAYPGDDGISMGTAVYDNRTQTIFLFYTVCSHVPGRASKAPARCPGGHGKFVLTSKDDGVSWSAPANITSQLHDMPGIWAPGPATGIQTATGRLLACGSYRVAPKYSRKPPIQSVSQCIASDDKGQTWRKVGFAAYSGVQGTSTDHQPNEVQPANLANGSILLNSRDVGKGYGHRLLTLSTDNGDTFGAARVEQQLYDYPSTAGSMIRHGGCLYVSNLGEDPLDRRINDPCEKPPEPSPCGSRHNLTLHASCDEAKTWRMLGCVHAAGKPLLSAYNTVLFLSDLPSAWMQGGVGWAGGV